MRIREAMDQEHGGAVADVEHIQLQFADRNALRGHGLDLLIQ
jgi:hypothetical protein